MDYMLAYKRFCQKAKNDNKKNGIVSLAQYNRLRSSSHQVHHILPKILGGKNSASNYILLDDNAHKYAHVLLNLALIQKGNADAIKRLNYFDCPEIRFLAKQNAMKSCKLAVYVEGKKHEPIVMHLPQAAKYFCFVARRSFMDNDALECLECQLIKMAMMNKAKFGYKVAFAL